MYKQNGSRDKVFEALVVRVPWPAWLAELEAGRYDNAKFVPGHLRGPHVGLRLECAVLFPETVSVAGRPANHFGGIFCDREAARFRRTSSAAAAVLRLNLPPDAAALLASEALSRDAYELWDLVHDRTHSHGDLPFDPFMIRQRMPYWMYSLEELRCDLTAYAEAVRLEGEGLSTARHAQYAILFDRLFRFPITGPRVRNYDGLGGQLLFAYLHRTRRLSWTDNRLTIDWEHVADGVLELRALVEELYKAGIDRTKVQHWAAAHDLVAAYVPPATGSRWAAGVRACPTWRTRGHTSTSCWTTSSRCRSSTAPCARSSRRRRRWPREPEPLAGRTYAIAGAGGGLGPSVARVLAAAGASLALADRGMEQLEPVVAELGLDAARLDARAVDLLDEAGHPRLGRRPAGALRRGRRRPAPRRGLARRHAARRGAARGLGGPARPAHPHRPAHLPRLPRRPGRLAARALRARVGAAGPEASGTNAAYGAAKAAAEAWTLALADDLSGTGATANIVIINALVTPQMRAANPDKAYKTFTDAGEIAETIAWLCSDAARKMNGRRVVLA
jgi:NAD(P)-dependent dehydrogenase (short-subunit alcohol dehydrogenase family)